MDRTNKYVKETTKFVSFRMDHASAALTELAAKPNTTILKWEPCGSSGIFVEYLELGDPE